MKSYLIQLAAGDTTAETIPIRPKTNKVGDVVFKVGVLTA
jgi:hypothetical protein